MEVADCVDTLSVLPSSVFGLVYSVVEMSISASDDDVEVSMEVTSVLGIFVDVEYLIGLEMLSKSVDETVDSSDSAIGLVKNVDIV